MTERASDLARCYGRRQIQKQEADGLQKTDRYSALATSPERAEQFAIAPPAGTLLGKCYCNVVCRGDDRDDVYGKYAHYAVIRAVPAGVRILDY